MPDRRALLLGHLRRLVRYATGSGVATVCSVATFALVYALTGSTTAATVLGWLAGAVPNYLLNRAWVWRVDGRPDVRREVAPYVAVVLGTVTLAAGATRLTEHLLEGAGATQAVVVAGVNAAFLGVYAVLALVRYALLHQLFRRLPDRGGRVPAGAAARASGPGAGADEPTEEHP
ncbi:GtrA family protein [Pseudokineococcus sp. 1T1Z-3]|uniref:GtrA family protein n=1 Tax=Pseudokineococcus sp. 1T1Z-3 TaxID=3132745 RepID=UPI0030A692CB